MDRHFNRARYNADQAVTVFAARLKDAVDLDSVRDDLASTVYLTWNPPICPCGLATATEQATPERRPDR